MGGSRKRTGKSQPIRKRKKNKQVLEKVSQRKEEKEQRLERKLAEADSRINQARLSALAIPFNSNSATQSVQNYKSDNYSDFNSKKDDEFRDANEEPEDDQLPDDAYDRLVDNLAKPLHVDKVVNKSQNTERVSSTKKKNQNQNSSKATQQRQKGTTELTNSKADEFIQLLTKNVDVENRAAAVRENKFFSFPPQQASKLADTSSSPNYTTVAEWPRLQVSTASMSAEASQEISKLAKQSTEPVSVGPQPTTLRRWNNHPSFKPAIGGQAASPLLRAVCATMRSFHDLMMCANIDPHTEDAVRSLYVAHCVSHVLRCRTRVLKNNALVNEDTDENDGGEDEDMPDESVLRDRGFVRARVLIIAPMRNIAYDVVNQIILLVGGGGTNKESDEGEEKGMSKVLYRDRFDEEFGPGEDEINEEEENESVNELKGDDLGLLKAGRGIRTKTKPAADHSRTFRGNVDDDFKMGISLSKKAIKLFSDFYESDFIVASPLGLRRSNAAKAVGQDKHSRLMREKQKKEEDTEWKGGIDSKVEKHVKDENDNGFLSSIEICVVDGANIFSMQNWDSLQRTLAMINNMPRNTRDTDFSRVREYCLDGLMTHFRQTIVLSQYRKSEMMAMFRTFKNHAGKVLVSEMPQSYGSSKQISVPMVRQTFFKIPGTISLSNATDKRLKYFFEQTLPTVRAIPDASTLVIIPSYFDFVRVRNRMVNMEEEDSTFRFSSMCEYSRAKDIVRARSRLYDGSIKLVIMTERFHFFYRHWIRGTNTIVWYGVPENSNFYPEIINMMQEALDEREQQIQSLALYDKFDIFVLQRIVGLDRSRRMISKQSRSTYLFV